MQTPVARDGLIYSAAGRVGGGAVRLTAAGGGVKAEEVYFNPGLPSAIGGEVLVGEYLYGTSQTALMAVEFRTGKVAWSDRSVACLGLLCRWNAVLHGEGGEVALVEATPRSLTGAWAVCAAESAETQQPDGKVLGISGYFRRQALYPGPG
jgi:hypothetical protein